MNAMSYKGYTATVEFDPADLIFVGRIAGINDVIGFHSDTANGLVEAFHEAVDDYVATCERVGKNPERPYSGNMMIRTDPELHAKVALAATVLGVSINQIAETALRQISECTLAERVVHTD
jgi:predicted HicB family RNase H-like nuclease